MLAHRDGSFEYPQHMFWLEIRKIIFSYSTLSGGLVHCNGPCYLNCVIKVQFYKENFIVKFHGKKTEPQYDCAISKSVL